MSFCLLADESVEDGIKRIVSEEIKQAIKEIDNPTAVTRRWISCRS
jgi:hypothetical protein